MTQHNTIPNKQSNSKDSWSNNFNNHSIYKWLFFLVILGSITVIIGYNTGFYGKYSSTNEISNINQKRNKTKNMEIEALVGNNSTTSNPSSILSNNPLVITDLENLSKQANWDNNYDTLVVPSGRIKSDLELEYTPVKNLSSLSKKPKLASIVLNINQLNNQIGRASCRERV